MASPAEIPHADEALKSLVLRFREAPGSAAFTELAAALLARGHAAEALRIAEHGLQLLPGDVEGRIERAAALLALGRPRVAFVELKRALAINATNRRAMRLLGKVYVDAGAPTRAAELLAQRFAKNADRAVDGEQQSSRISAAPYPSSEARVDGAGSASPAPMIHRFDTEPLPRRPMPPAHASPPTPAERSTERSTERSLRDPAPAPLPSAGLPAMPAAPAASLSGATSLPATASQPPAPAQVSAPTEPAAQPIGQAIPELFSDLTRDLGLSEIVPEAPVTRVEVTQVIRRRAVGRTRSPSELGEIEGPIVDTTQPGQITETSADLINPPLGWEPPPLFDAVTSPRLQLAPFGLDDEPLFQEHMPFAVRPVESGNGDADPGAETMEEEIPDDLRGAFLRAGIRERGTAVDPAPPALSFADSGDTLVDHLEEADEPPEDLSAPSPAADLLPDARKSAEPADIVRFDGSMPLLEVRSGRRMTGAPKLEVIAPRTKRLHVALAVAGGVFMLIYLVILMLAAPAAWKPRLTGGSGKSSGHAIQRSKGSKVDRPARDEGAPPKKRSSL